MNISQYHHRPAVNVRLFLQQVWGKSTYFLTDTVSILHEINGLNYYNAVRLPCKIRLLNDSISKDVTGTGRVFG